MKKFPFFIQRENADCGATCLKMITRFYGREYSIQTLRKISNTSVGGATMLDLSETAEKLGLRALGVSLKSDQLPEVNLPCILHWRQNHFVILYKLSKGNYYIADPSIGKYKFNQAEFTKCWLPLDNGEVGSVLLLDPSPKFYNSIEEPEPKLNWNFILRYLFNYKQLLAQLVLALLVGLIIQLSIPFLTQATVDIGIDQRNLKFINIILIAQITLFLGGASADFIKSWILLHISTRVNISIITDFLIKLMKLPMSFFDTKSTGDIIQRIHDEKRIENFLTVSTLSVVFSTFNFVIFSIIISTLNFTVFLVFFFAFIIYVAWILLFMNRRRKIDYKQFANQSHNQDNIIEIIEGISDIKLNNLEFQKRWKWEHIQAKMFKLNVKTLALDQYQQAGAMFINQGKNLVITYLCAKGVIDGNMTLGGMMAIQYIIGQLNGPVEQFIGFAKNYQDAKISIERMNEVHSLIDEEPPNREFVEVLPDDKDIHIEKLTFSYPGAGNLPVLEDINLIIPSGKTTAIVGLSGSGKTTLLKLLLRFYEPEVGSIKIGSVNLKDVKFKLWRDACGAVMQNGYLFAESIANNINLGTENESSDRLDEVVKISNINDIIDALPYGINSKISSGGEGLSQGQKQRILIGRAIFKNPDYLFFDEATNSLDATNEKAIVENLGKFLKGKTILVIAHRLSTVRNADKIVVLHKGKIIEEGSHDQLIQLKGDYYHLIKNQLEIGN